MKEFYPQKVWTMQRILVLGRFRECKFSISASSVRAEAQRNILEGLVSSWGVFPLLDGCCRIVGEDGIASQNFDVGYTTIREDGRSQADHAANLGMAQDIGVI